MPLVDFDLPLLALGKQLALEMGRALHGWWGGVAFLLGKMQVMF